MNPRRWLGLGVILVPIGLLLLIARAELTLASGQVFRVGIAGYDPRDLLHGHYLQYRYVFDWQGEPTCGAVAPSETSLGDPRCCVCLTRAQSPEQAPSARQVSCAEAMGCDGFLRVQNIEPPLRYFIPEAQASALERALIEHRAAVDLTVRANGEAIPGELYLDGQPWREVVALD